MCTIPPRPTACLAARAEAQRRRWRAVFAPVSLGTDTGGSIRQPASFCGVVGVKPTYGRVSRYGLTAFASSLDCIGPFSRTVKDSATLLKVIAGRDPADSTSGGVDVPDYNAALDGNVKGLRLGVPKEYFGSGLDAEVGARIDHGLDVLKKLGCEVSEVSLPHTDYAIASYYLICTAEASANLARYDGVRYTKRAENADTLGEMYRKTRAAGFGREVTRRIILGTYVLSSGYYDAYYLKAQRVRSLIASDFKRAFDKVDALITPVSPFPAFKIGEKTRRPARDVSLRHLHHHGQPGGHRRHQRSLRRIKRRAADRHADLGGPLRRTPHAQTRRCLREGRRLRGLEAIS